MIVGTDGEYRQIAWEKTEDGIGFREDQYEVVEKTWVKDESPLRSLIASPSFMKVLAQDETLARSLEGVLAESKLGDPVGEFYATLFGQTAVGS